MRIDFIKRGEIIFNDGLWLHQIVNVRICQQGKGKYTISDEANSKLSVLFSDEEKWHSYHEN